MSRPKHLKKIELEPFLAKPLQSITMTPEETYALYLKDIEGLHQEACASKMDISRGYFQQVLDRARKKTAQAALTGASLVIEGGEFIMNTCVFTCSTCGNTYTPKLVKDQACCPTCLSTSVQCSSQTPQCKRLNCGS